MSPLGSNWQGDGHAPRDHPNATLRYEGINEHTQVTPEEASINAWYYRPTTYGQLVPDTRRCRVCGQILFDPLPLTEAQAKLRSPMSTQVLLHEDGF